MIDLHTHTSVSDGGDNPSYLVSKAAAVGLAALAVTDHDNVSGCDEAVAAGRRFGVEVIRGVEISCDVDDLTARGLVPTARATMHLLGYFVPTTANPLSAALSRLQDVRADRNRRIVARLNELGIPVTFDEVEREAGGVGSQIGRPHFAAVLVRHGVVSDHQAAFDEYLAKGAKAYLGRRLYGPVEAIELMISAGVVPVLAHPFTLNLSLADLETFVSALAVAGLRGIEGYHGDWRLDEQEVVRDLGRRYSLVLTGGSDYHGDMRPDRGLPGGKHGVRVPVEALDRLRAAAEALQGA